MRSGSERERDGAARAQKRDDEAGENLQRDMARQHVGEETKDSEIGRERNEMTSISTISGSSQPGTPGGKKSPRKCVPCLMKP